MCMLLFFTPVFSPIPLERLFKYLCDSVPPFPPKKLVVIDCLSTSTVSMVFERGVYGLKELCTETLPEAQDRIQATQRHHLLT